jgi:hypothetical protein
MGVETADRYKGMALRLHETDAIQMGAQKASAVVEVLDAANPSRDARQGVGIGGCAVVVIVFHSLQAGSPNRCKPRTSAPCRTRWARTESPARNRCLTCRPFARTACPGTASFGRLR